MEIQAFQQLIADTYLAKDTRRGLAWTYAWFIEEVGELATALREGDADGQREEFADVFAWMCGLANLAGIDLNEVVSDKYGRGCPACSQTPCTCQEDLSHHKEASR